jgi:AcrR family transcriptional regulator
VSAPAQPVARRRDAAGSRRDLLSAARTLFADRGYESTTVRDIGERAGVDPTLIARYFGSKAKLYLEILEADNPSDGDGLADILEPARMSEILNRFSHTGPGPILHGALRRNGDPDIQAAMQTSIENRILAPLRRRMDATGVPDAPLRAELIMAAFAGIALACNSGANPQLSAASNDQIVDLVVGALSGLLEV